MGDGHGAATRRHPDKRTLIEELIRRDDDFRSLCDDLADAEDALTHWEQSSSPHREERSAEYRSLVERLDKDLLRAIEMSHVIPFRRPKT